MVSKSETREKSLVFINLTENSGTIKMITDDKRRSK
jgi:hypothetical protein